MKRFVFGDAALQDMDAIIGYIRSLPRVPGIDLGKDLRGTLESIAEHPGLGAIHQEASEIATAPSIAGSAESISSSTLSKTSKRR